MKSTEFLLRHLEILMIVFSVNLQLFDVVIADSAYSATEFRNVINCSPFFQIRLFILAFDQFVSLETACARISLTAFVALIPANRSRRYSDLRFFRIGLIGSVLIFHQFGLAVDDIRAIFGFHVFRALVGVKLGYFSITFQFSPFQRSSFHWRFVF